MGGEDKLSVASSVSPSRKRSNNISDLKKQRGNIKGRLTLFKKYLDSFIDVSVTKLQIKEIKFRMKAAQDYFKSFNDIQGQIDLLLPESEHTLDFEYVESFESLYFNILAIAEGIVESEETRDYSKSKCNDQPSQSSIKLPDIKLPSFDGSFEQWLEYKNSYTTMIHNRSDLDEIQKFHYLKSSLSGSALQVISALEFTASNYIHAWELLDTRFHNIRLLIHNHLKSLFSISPIKIESYTHIRKLIDTILKNLRALKTLNEPTEYWDTLIIYLVVSKLDIATERDWENHIGSILTNSDRRLKLDDLLSFLRNKSDMLEMIHTNNKSFHQKSILNDNKTSHSKSNYLVHASISNNTNKFNSKNKSDNNKKHIIRNYNYCVLCSNSHPLYTCHKFLNLSIEDRLKLVTKNQLCTNCLRSSSHSAEECLFGSCKECQGKHNTLLHCTRSVNNATNSSALHSLATSRALSGDINSCLQTVLLSTALVEILDRDNRVHTARALLDNGSQHSFISERLFKRLNTPSLQSTIHISGVAQSVTQSNKSCEIIMRSKLNDYCANVRCFVLQHITSKLPTTNIDVKHIRIPPNIRLADPSFYISSEIDLLIGADLFWQLLDDDKIKLDIGPYLQNSKLGWLLSGPLYTTKLISKKLSVHCNFNQSLDEQLKRFWEIENVYKPCNTLTLDERICEELFMNTTKREPDGRFSVRIPLKESLDTLGDSFNMAKNRFLSLERRLYRSPEYKRMYCEFINEYEKLGHMTRVDKVESKNYFLIHHGVFKEHSETTKLRVVFNASAVTSSGKSLNDIQLPGPALQNDIFSILLRFRQYKYVACADVEKMFRQVLIQPDQRALQYIVWRNNLTDPLHIFQLNTVTYGTASAPYLSMRCIRQLALECNDDVISRVIHEDIFVDDLITGCDDPQELLDICEKTAQVLRSGCFSLRKWTFNSNVSLNEPATHQFVGEHTQNKTLGIGWCSESDNLYYATKIDTASDILKPTKRVMLSVISQIYDPLGLLSPAVIISKILLQKLWLSKLDWDTPLPSDILIAWNKFIKTLKYLNELKIPRHVMSDHIQYKELHIFVDASQNAYGSCAYIRTYSDDSDAVVTLLCAKSKVAPLKSISIPRLELCGALVGARLYKKIIEVLRLTFTQIFFWTDSTVVIGWLSMSPHLLKPFVQNRVTEINDITHDSKWLHVSSKDNPADLLSRGLTLDMLVKCDLWWYGPSYLKNKTNYFISNDIIDVQKLPDLRSNTIIHNLNCVESIDFIQFNKYSSFSKLVRTYAYILRFITNARCSYSKRSDRITGLLSKHELNKAERILLYFSQRQSFPNLYDYLLNNKKCNKNNNEINRVSGLNVFIDNQRLIRVGGRIKNASTFDYDKKHPILMCSRHWLSILLVRREHRRLLHAGPQMILANLREKWWLLGGRNLIRKIVRECITCSRVKGKTLQPIMGNLPSERLDAGFPFKRTGVDYAGPIMILNRKGRGAREIKSYICLFICFLTRAIHLELVTSLSTEDYILALKRFISRRGKPSLIYSDNGRNFVGAEKELSLLIKNSSNQIVDYATSEGIEFYFIPPYSPHFGGLWESGIRSCKHHLKRVVGNAKLTYEELSTVLIQIEAVLNSRPLSPLSTDPTDLTPLTPGHFLIGRPLTALPSKHNFDTTGLALNRYHRVEQLRQHFWQRWSKEYIGELQQRTKWKSHRDDIALDSLVLIKDENLPPLKWRLGRISRVYPGTDGISRVADVRTSAGTVKRAFSRICPLPIQ